MCRPAAVACAALLWAARAVRPSHSEDESLDDVTSKVLSSLVDLVAQWEHKAHELSHNASFVEASLVDLHQQHPVEPKVSPFERERQTSAIFENMKRVCTDPPKTQNQVTSKETLSMLRQCVKGIKSYIELTKSFQKESYEANKRHRESVDNIVQHLSQLENYVEVVNAYNSDHTKVKNDLMRLSKITCRKIKSLLGGDGEDTTLAKKSEDAKETKKSEDVEEAKKSEDAKDTKKIGDAYQAQKSEDAKDTKKIGDAKDTKKIGDAYQAKKSGDAEEVKKSGLLSYLR